MNRKRVLIAGAIVVASISAVSAHVVKGLSSPALATAFVSSPSAGTDTPIRLQWGAADMGLRVVCFFAANTSLPRVDRPGWPRITSVGFELPGSPSGFALLSPLDGDWELAEGVQTSVPEHDTVTLDFAIMARVNPTGRTPGQPQDPRGIPPGQAGVRGSGTRFCVSGPFPNEIVAGQATTIEQVINGVVVGFRGVPGTRHESDAGVWDNAARIIPLFP